jgi:hypothetical protein
VNLYRDGDRPLQLLVLNEEFLVSASHQLALITSLPFVHTARRYYRLNGLVRPPDWVLGLVPETGEAGQTWSFRGSTSRNKVSVGEPAEGSLTNRAGCAVPCYSGAVSYTHPHTRSGPFGGWMHIYIYSCIILSNISHNYTNHF